MPSPTGIFSLPLSNLRDLIAACPAFWAWTGTANAAAALARVHLFDLPVPAAGDGLAYGKSELQGLRPYAVLYYLQQIETQTDQKAWILQRSSQGTFVEGGELLVEFVADPSADLADDPAGQMIDFCNKLGAVLKEMLVAGGGDTDYLSVHAMRLYDGPSRADAVRGPAQGEAIAARFVVTWGI